MSEVPKFVQDSSLVADAFQVARDAHESRRRVDESSIEHPIAVADLLADAGFGEETVAAAVLHDVVEDTTIDLDEIEDRFGAEVRDLVEAMTDDERIESWAERKAEHRERVAAHGREAAAIYAADKLAKVRALNVKGRPARPGKLDHYRASAQLLRSRYPDLPFLDELERTLSLLDERVGAGSGS